MNINPNQNSEGVSPTAQAAELQSEVSAASILPDPVQPADPKPKEATKQDGPTEHNARALKHIVTQIPSSLTPFFQGISISHGDSFCLTLNLAAVVKLPLLYSRRSPDAAQKRHAVVISGHVANIASQHLL
jgi:E3 ubiquitin-protein ligase HUWE1